MKNYLLGLVIAHAMAFVTFELYDAVPPLPALAYAVEPIPVEEVTTEPARTLTEGERDLLAAIVYAEANTEPLEGKRYMVDTVLNRVDDDRFPDSVTAVIFQPNQYWTRGLPKTYESIPEECYEAVDMELAEQLNTEVLYFRTGHYHNFGTAVAQVGNHFFSK